MSDTQKAGAVNQLTDEQKKMARKFFTDNQLAPPYDHELEELQRILASRQPAAKDVEKAAEAAYEAGGYVRWQEQTEYIHAYWRKVVTAAAPFLQEQDGAGGRRDEAKSR